MKRIVDQVIYAIFPVELSSGKMVWLDYYHCIEKYDSYHKDTYLLSNEDYLAETLKGNIE